MKMASRVQTAKRLEKFLVRVERRLEAIEQVLNIEPDSQQEELILPEELIAQTKEDTVVMKGKRK